MEVSNMARCCVNVFDSNTQRYRKCMHKGKWGTLGKCSVHVRNHAILIQATWRMYSTKRRINLFKKLPDDAWAIVMKHIECKNNVVNLLKSHLNIYLKRYRDLKNHPWWNVHQGVLYYKNPIIYNRCVNEVNNNIFYFQGLINKC